MPVLGTPEALSPAARHQQQQQRRGLLTLAIETSCDDTCVAVLQKDDATGAATLHCNLRVTSDNRRFGGVHPATAMEGHTRHLARLVQEALRSLPPARPGQHALPLPLPDGARRRPDFVAVTRGPGMGTNLAAGMNTAKGLAVAWGVPLVGVHHMQAHALTPRLVSALALSSSLSSSSSISSPTSSSPPSTLAEAAPAPAPAPAPATPSFPYLSLLVSGGHTQLVQTHSATRSSILATIPSGPALGDMLDKAARDVLPAETLRAAPGVMYARELEAFAFPARDGTDPAAATDDDPYGWYTPPARRADEVAAFSAPAEYGWQLVPPLARSRARAFDYAALGSQVQRVAAERGAVMGTDERRLLARETMRLAFEHLGGRVLLLLEGGDPALRDHVRTLVVSGGVASNRFLMHVLRSMLGARGFGHVDVTAPPPTLCTDNAAMIAWAGMEMFELGWESELSIMAVKKWPLDEGQDAGTRSDEDRRTGGIVGAGGWIRRDGHSVCNA